MLAGWSIAIYVLLKVLVTTAPQDKRHAKVTSIALVMGWLGVADGGLRFAPGSGNLRTGDAYAFHEL